MKTFFSRFFPARVRTPETTTQFFGLVSAAMSLDWAVWLLFSERSHFLFTPLPVYWFLHMLFPHWLLCVLFLAYGGGYIGAVLWRSYSWQRGFFLMGGFLWSLVGYSALFAGHLHPRSGAYFILAGACGWAFVRTRIVP